MHILFLTDNFPPEVNAPASRTFEHCREWVKRGHEVTVITCAPNFPKGKVYDGYKNKLFQTEQMDNIKVIRVWTYITANEGVVKRIPDFISFMLAAIPASFSVKKPTLVIGTSPQLFTACGAYLVSRMKRIPFIFELRDIWPESIKAVGAMGDSMAIRVLESIALFLYRKADQIVPVTNSFKQSLIKRGVDGSKIDVITNGVDLSRFSPREKDQDLVRKYNLKGKFVAGYIGTHGLAHALETILDTAKMMEKQDRDDFRFLFLGHGAEKQKLMDKAHEMGLNHVIFIDSVTKDEVANYWSLLDVSIIHLKNTPQFTKVIPSKLFECMGMGIPVLHGVAGESAEIVERVDCGITFEPENSTELFNCLQDLQQDSARYNKLRQNCLAGAKQFERTVLARRMLEILTKKTTDEDN